MSKHLVSQDVGVDQKYFSRPSRKSKTSYEQLRLQNRIKQLGYPLLHGETQLGYKGQLPLASNSVCTGVENKKNIPVVGA